MVYIKNKSQLQSHGNTELRKDSIEIIEHALKMADPYRKVKELVRLERNTLMVGEIKYNLGEYGRIFVIGAGKATYSIARALEEILGNKIEDGIITTNNKDDGKLSYCRLYFGSHPLPNEKGLEASLEMMELAKQTRPKDIIFCAITGGSTALMPLPVSGIDLADLQVTYRVLLRSSANIIEMNSVRKHLSKITGGWLAKNIHPKAEIINLTVSDVVGDPLDYITCPTVPDTSTLDDARTTLSNYTLWEEIPKSVKEYLQNAGPEQETPKDLTDHNIHNYILVKNEAACVAAAEKANQMGYNTMILSTMLEGESKEVGTMFASISKEIMHCNRPIPRPCAIIAGGETTIRIEGLPGKGGPNQQFALSSATWITGLNGVVISGIDTDGIDGVSDLAGGMVDGQTFENAKQKSIDIVTHIKNYDDTPALKKLGDGIYTGISGTNVNDLKLMLVK